MRYKILLLTVMAAVSLYGCKSNEQPVARYVPPEQPTVLNPQDKTPQTRSRDLLVETEKNFRRGAAIDGGGDKHFLDINRTDCVYCGGLPDCPSPILTSKVKYDPRHHEPRATASAPTRRSSILDRLYKGSSKDYSYYDLSRWERFCNGGWAMDSIDWKFVKNSKKHPFPVELQANCKVPSNRMLRRHGFKI
ncbi:MAG: hypothetical protein PUA61_08375 [Succinatimonas hippei]|nr:hypothetical protein [Succinatimonas hippei]